MRDIRDSALYREAHALYAELTAPGTGQICDAADAQASPDGKRAVFAGTIVEKFEGALPTRICQVDLATAETAVLTFGPNTDRLPKYSPDGRQIAFLSDRSRAGDFQLYLLDPITGEVRPAPPVQGWVEYLHWSPDGGRILLGVAGHGADVAGGQGAMTSRQQGRELPSWAPVVETGDESFRWRRAWIYELASHTVRPIDAPGENIWEATWCGSQAIAAVVSAGPGEGLWYSAALKLIDVSSGEVREIYRPRDQLGWPAGSPSGRHLAVVDAVCSDRWLVAGDLLLFDTASGKAHGVDTRGVDVTYTEWRCDRTLLLGGHRGYDTVFGVYDLMSDVFEEIWSSREVTPGGRLAKGSGYGPAGDCVLAAESFTRAPEIGVIRAGEYHTVHSFDLGYAEWAKAIASVRCVSWKAPDGIEIQGWLLLPQGKAPHPLVMNIHGGPVWHWRPMWLGRSRYAPLCMLLARGYAIFLPNPRGSSGRGRDFARRVVGEMGGADTRDYLSGLDFLVEQGLVDPLRLGVTGVSYGGFMTAWLITQDLRFAAAVPIAPIANHVTEQLMSNIPHFVPLFLGDTYTNPGGKYFQRSPVMHVRNARTPTLNICGALDRCTPPEEAAQFHYALLESGVESVLVTYPEEGHGIHQFPAAIDFAARTVGWLEAHV